MCDWFGLKQDCFFWMSSNCTGLAVNLHPRDAVLATPLALVWPAMRISCDDNIVIKLSHHFQNIVKILFRYCPNFEDITQYLFMKYWPILALHGPVQAKLIVWFSNGLTCISQNKCILCNCNAFNASNNNIRMPIVTSRWNALLEEEKCKDCVRLAMIWQSIGTGLA